MQGFDRQRGILDKAQAIVEQTTRRPDRPHQSPSPRFEPDGPIHASARTAVV
jgi:hypothetical protein